MSVVARKHLPLSVAVLMMVALVGPYVVAETPGTDPGSPEIGPAAVSNINADRVDGKHAVGYRTNPAKRKKRLVATNKKGYLPDNITKATEAMGKNEGDVNQADNPIHWKQLKGVPAQIAHGSYVTFTWPCGGNVPAGGTKYVVLEDLPRIFQYQFMVLPTGGTGSYLYVDRVEYQQNTGGEPANTLDVWVRVGNVGAATNCNIRGIIFIEGVSAAVAKRKLSRVEVSSTRQGH